MKEFSKSYLVPIAIYAVFAAAGLAFISLFLHINLFGGIVLYYMRILAYVFLAFLISAAVSALFIKKLSLVYKNAIGAALIIQFCVCATFVTIAPTNIDRSFSVFFLSEMYENPDKTYSQAELESLFVDRYVLIGGVTRRLNEQISLGYIADNAGQGYALTPKGRALIETMRLIEKAYPIDGKAQLYPNLTKAK
ncbi:MAG: hypothetical protein LBI57_07725 [Helicobacteraceae bacterium]|jgi:hypothetical protein|nr:hypothetical protein [Helicobacteraceae bacterium]